MIDKTMTIGTLARLTHTNPAVIREYEHLALLPPPVRPAAGRSTHAHRMYGQDDVRRLTFLRRCRDLGVMNPSLLLLTQLIDTPTEAGQEVREFAWQLLCNLKDHLQEMHGMAETLTALIEGSGKDALALGDVSSASSEGFKRMRRRVRKPMKTQRTSRQSPNV